MAEKEGVEPSHACAPNDLANRPLRPLGYFSKSHIYKTVYFISGAFDFNEVLNKTAN